MELRRGQSREGVGHEVSCRFTRYSIEAFEERGLARESYLAGVRYPAEHLLDDRQTISWDGYCRLMRNGTHGWTDQEFIELGRNYASHSAGRAIQALARLFYSPAEFSRFLVPIGADRFFTCIHHRIEELGPDRVLIDSIVVAPYEPFPEQFLIARGAMESIPLLYDLPLASIDFEPTERGARLDITLPSWTGPLSRLRRFISWPLRGRAARRDLRGAFAELQVRHQNLQQQFEAHRRSEAERSRLITAVEQTSDGITMVGPDARIVYANPAFAEMMATSAEKLVGEPVSILAQGSGDVGLLQEIAQTTARGRIWKGRYQSTWQDGSSHVREASITPMRFDGSEDVYLVAVVCDVTREATLDQTLQQRQRMESVGRLAGGVAHDFNNLLTVILGFAEVLEDPTTVAHDADHAVREITRAATSAADLTGQLLAFGRKQLSRPRVLDLNETVREIGAMLSRLVGERIDLKLHLDANPARVRADLVQIEQVVTNLVVNACDAMPGGGSVHLATRLATAEDRAATELAIDPHGHVVLEVSDTGTGMDPVTSSQVFEPFFTTKDPGHGTGLGLSTVYGIVQQAGGEIRIRSRIGQGTTVEIYLPQTGEASTALPSRPQRAVAWPVDRTVLLVEDEQAVRRVLRLVLEDAGLSVIPCADGHEALEVARKTPVDILLSDVVMPGIDGIELSRRLREMQPTIRTILMSGYPAPATSAPEPPPGTAILTKPFSSAKLQEALHQVSS